MNVKVSRVQLCNPKDFSRRKNWSGWPIPPPAALPNPGIEPGSPALQVDSLPAELRGETEGEWIYPLRDNGYMYIFAVHFEPSQHY